jgi:DNA-binding NarL/FixJ family response regulator
MDANEEMAEEAIPVPRLRAVAPLASALARGLRPAPEENGHLTVREREILGRLAEGLSTPAIAEALAISQTTVRNHTQRILAKLGAHTRLAAVVKGHAMGLIAMRPPEVRRPGGRR